MVAAEPWPTVGVAGFAGTTELVSEPFNDSVTNVVGTLERAVDCVWFAAVKVAELAAALMTSVAEASTLVLEPEEETEAEDEGAAARTCQ